MGRSWPTRHAIREEQPGDDHWCGRALCNIHPHEGCEDTPQYLGRAQGRPQHRRAVLQGLKEVHQPQDDGGSDHQRRS